jgi:hypothetical protein
MERAMDDKELAGYVGSPSLWGDDMHNHFDKFGRWDWVDVKAEGSRVYGLMFDCDVEDDSPIDDLISAVAAQAHDGAMCAVAACLGVPARALTLAVAEWSENQDQLPPPVASMDAFVELIRDNQKWLDDLHKPADAA